MLSGSGERPTFCPTEVHAGVTERDTFAPRLGSWERVRADDIRDDQSRASVTSEEVDTRGPRPCPARAPFTIWRRRGSVVSASTLAAAG